MRTEGTLNELNVLNGSNDLNCSSRQRSALSPGTR